MYTRGRALADGARIQLADTAVPVELDRIFSSLDDLDVALGPGGREQERRPVPAARRRRRQPGRQGSKINHTLTDLSQAIGTLSDGRDDLFATVRNLQVFTTALATSDTQVRAFNTDLASVADQLAGERGELALALKNLAVALGEVASLRADNRANLTTDISGLADITGDAGQAEGRAGRDPRRRPGRAVQPAERLQPGVRHPRHPRQRPAAGRPGPVPVLAADLARPAARRVCDQIDKVLKNKQLAPSPAASPQPGGGPDLTLGGILGRYADEGPAGWPRPRRALLVRPAA